jgi:hypothetical protein
MMAASGRSLLLPYSRGNIAVISFSSEQKGFNFILTTWFKFRCAATSSCSLRASLINLHFPMIEAKAKMLSAGGKKEPEEHSIH